MSTAVFVLELIGLYVFATSGALMAIHKDFDVVGIVILAVLTALGGGIVRDLIIGDVPPAAFREILYLAIPIGAALITFFVHPIVNRLKFTILVLDAAGLGMFTVYGTLKALNFGLGWLQAMLLGVVTAVGGGVLRDITARELPSLVRVDDSLFAIPAAVGAAIVVIAYHLEWSMTVVGPLAALLVFGFRMTALLLHWTAPRAYRRHRKA